MRSTTLNLPFGSNRFTAALKPAEHPLFYALCQACRRGDVNTIKSLVLDQAVPINARDAWDATPLYYASLTGHMEAVKLLLENGAMADPSTFEGERCLYAALNDAIRKELRSYGNTMTMDDRADYALLFLGLYNAQGQSGMGCDVSFVFSDGMISEFLAHRFMLVSRSPYFAQQLLERWPPSSDSLIPVKKKTVHPTLLAATMKYLYTGLPYTDASEIPSPLWPDWKVIAKAWKLPQLEKEIEDLIQEEAQPRIVPKLNKKAPLLTNRIDEIQNAMWILVACLFNYGHQYVEWTESGSRMEDLKLEPLMKQYATTDFKVLFQQLHKKMTDKQDLESLEALGILLIHASKPDVVLSLEEDGQWYHFPVHKAIVCKRSEFFSVLLEGDFVESQSNRIPLHSITNTSVFSTCLEYLYTDRITTAEQTCLESGAIHELIQAADVLLLDKLKNQIAQFIIKTEEWSKNDLLLFLDASTMFHMPRLEAWTTKAIAHDLDGFLDLEFRPALLQRVRDSIDWVSKRDESAGDSIPLIDDLRYYLSVRFQVEDWSVVSSELPFGEHWTSDVEEMKRMEQNHLEFSRLMLALDEMLKEVGGKVVDRMAMEMDVA